MSFPRLLVPRPPQNSKSAAASTRPPEKPLGHVFRPGAAADCGRSKAAPVNRVEPVFVPGLKAPQPEFMRRYDAYGRETLLPEDIPF
jgi:hypothetical protein